jgi:SAM-dependent methyltransferase
MKLTDEELAAMPPKAVRYPEEVKLYQEHDFLTAYSLHTEKRIRETSYKHAIGGGENWEEHGQLQLDFLISQGLRQNHSLLDIGCGTGRLARKAAPYCHYWGVDISGAAADIANELSRTEGWDKYRPTISCNWPHGARFDFLWAFSVFIHLPQNIMEDTMKRAAEVMHAGSKFLFAYVPNEVSARTGLKQFRKTRENYVLAAKGAGLTFDELPDWVFATIGERPDWAGHQRVALAQRRA